MEKCVEQICVNIIGYKKGVIKYTYTICFKNRKTKGKILMKRAFKTIISLILVLTFVSVLPLSVSAAGNYSVDDLIERTVVDGREIVTLDADSFAMLSKRRDGKSNEEKLDEIMCSMNNEKIKRFSLYQRMVDNYDNISSVSLSTVYLKTDKEGNRRRSR